MNLQLFEKLGVLDQVEHIGIRKPGVELISPWHETPVTLNFCDAWDKTYPYAFQVRRSQLDKILFDHCVESGTRALQSCRVLNVAFPQRGGVAVTTCGKQGRVHWRARYLVDASGRDTFLGNKLSIKKRNRRHASAALYGHFEGAHRLPGEAEGNISLFWFEHGWFWFIPLRDGTTSVGAVCTPEYMRRRRNDPSSFLMETIALSPCLEKRLEHAHLLTEATATGNYSYDSKHMIGERYIMVGDAYAFVDPVFSSGVYLAMQSAFKGADVVDSCLRDPAAATRAKRDFEKSVHHALRHFSWFIYRMTRPVMRTLFMTPRNHLRMQEALLSLLSGDLYRGTPIYRSLVVFKTIYYVTSAFKLRQTMRAWRARRKALQDLEAQRAS